MFGIGFPELLLIMALALIVVGPDKLPDLARSIAKTLLDLKKTAEGLKNSLQIEDNPLHEIKPELEEAAKNFKETILDAEKSEWKRPSDDFVVDVDADLAEKQPDVVGEQDKNNAPDASTDNSADKHAQTEEHDKPATDATKHNP